MTLTLCFPPQFPMSYGVATTSRLLNIIGLFCRISSLLLGSFAKETYNFKESTDRSHPICHFSLYSICRCSLPIILISLQSVLSRVILRKISIFLTYICHFLQYTYIILRNTSLPHDVLRNLQMSLCGGYDK